MKSERRDRTSDSEYADLGANGQELALRNDILDVLEKHGVMLMNSEDGYELVSTEDAIHPVGSPLVAIVAPEPRIQVPVEFVLSFLSKRDATAKDSLQRGTFN